MKTKHSEVCPLYAYVYLIIKLPVSVYSIVKFSAICSVDGRNARVHPL